MKIKSVILLGPALLLASSLFGQMVAAPTLGTTTTTPTPMTEKEVISELKKDGADTLIKDLGRRGVDFETDADIEKRLRKAHATDDVVKAVKAAGPKERENAAKAAIIASGGIVVPPEENAAFEPIKTELDPDKAIAMAESFVQKYPKSPLLSYAYAFEANAYQMKQNVAKIVECGEKSLEYKKDNLMSLMLVAYAIPTPQYVQLHGSDEETQLTKGEDYAQEAIKTVSTLPKPPNESDADFASRKATYLADLHADLGMIHLDRAQLGLMGLDKEELAKAEKEYRVAVTSTDKPDPSAYYRMGEACRLQGKLDDAIAAFTKASALWPPTMKKYADDQIELVKKMKAAAPPAK
jgi:tetratricopeptide (TPR) repeat protein